MAEKSTKKAPATKQLSVQDQLVQRRSELLELRKSHASGELVNPRAITLAKKDIARLLTQINAEKEAK